LTTLAIGGQIGIQTVTVLPPIPNTLKLFNCYGCSLTALPNPLPDSLTWLICEYNSLTSIPALPAGLQYFSCNGNNITTLPALPASLITLQCNTTLLTSLPPLATTTPLLQNLDCSFNNLTSLPVLPPSCTSLNCSNDSLTSLPPLRNMIFLTCDHNNLTSIPPVSSSLYSFKCNNNPHLSCLPWIYNINPSFALADFYISGTDIHCLPRNFTALNFDVNPGTMQVCGPGSGCDFYYTISGNVHMDTAATCQIDSLYPGAPVRNVKVQLLRNGQVAQQVYTLASGNYSFVTDTLANYTVVIDTPTSPLTVICPVSRSISAALSVLDSVSINDNFGLTCSSVDYEVKYIQSDNFRPGRATTIYVQAGNASVLNYNVNCGGSSAGTVKTIFSGPVHYVGPAAGSLTPTSISGDTLTYSVADLNTLQPNSLNFIVTTDSAAAIGSAICLTAIITPSVADANIHDDTMTKCSEVGNSFDPNHKTVSPLDTFQSGKWLTYTIHFQNTGNDTAYLVVLRDTLSPYVDASSFEYLASSHHAVIQLFGNAMAFTFPHINLVDSFDNPALSTGWIQYKVRAKANLPVGTQVKNTASIYFDNNPAIVTNTTVNVVDTVSHSLGIYDPARLSTISLHPNPNKGTFTLQTSGSINAEYTISDMLGHIILQQTITTDDQQIDMHDAADGVYTLTVKGAQPLRFVVMR
jgi:uncharacterized repeat protein (TIGR01451 family)